MRWVFLLLLTLSSVGRAASTACSVTTTGTFCGNVVTNKILATVQLSGTWSGNLQLRVVNTTTAYAPISVTSVTTGRRTMNMTANGTYLADVSGFTMAVLSATAWTSGTATALVSSTEIVGTSTLPINLSDSPIPSVQLSTPSTNEAVDAFGRFRVSNPTTLFDSKLIHGRKDLLWTSLTTTGCSYTLSPSFAHITLTAGVGSSMTVTMRTRQYWNYEPGKSQRIAMTGNFQPLTGAAGTAIRKFMGYMDASNGLFWSLTTAASTHTFQVGIRQNGTDTYVSQSSWNIDPMDGTGPSGKTLDTSKANIYNIDFQWLGVGSVRWSVNIDGNEYLVHQNRWANSNYSTYMATPNLPITYQIVGDAVGNTQTMLQICSSVLSEGGYQGIGIPVPASRRSSGITVDNAGYYPLVAVRAVSSYPNVRIAPKDLSIMTSTTGDFHYLVIMNPSGYTGGTWRTITDTAAEMNTGVTSTVGVDSGHVIHDSYVASSSSESEHINLDYPIATGTDATNGDRDIFVLVATKIGAGSDTFYGTLSCREE